MRKLSLINCFAIISLLVLQACVVPYMDINRVEDFVMKKADIKKIIYVNPIFASFEDDAFEEIDIQQTERLKSQLERFLKSKSKSYKIKMDFLQSESFEDTQIQDMIEDLIPMRNELQNTIQLQNNPLNYSRSTRTSVTKQVFVVPVKLSPQWSYLGDKYQTRYFGFLGVFNGPRKTMVANYVFDVVRSELIYQSLVNYPGKASQPMILQLLHSTFTKLNESK